MQDHTSPTSLENAIAMQKYGVGQPVLRKEDDTLVRGKGKYTDDFSLPTQAYGWVVRSSHAHGIRPLRSRVSSFIQTVFPRPSPASQEWLFRCKL